MAKKVTKTTELGDKVVVSEVACIVELKSVYPVGKGSAYKNKVVCVMSCSAKCVCVTVRRADCDCYGCVRPVCLPL